jgi:ABC-2 type transport system ATP-binding protein
MLGLLKAQSGSVRMLGRDPVKDPVGVLSRVGYLSEERDLPPWMRIGELIRYCRAFYPTWDDAYAESLRERFDLDPTRKIKALSQGQKARAGLLVALAYRPEVLVLDEPSTGLDPIVRRDILGAILRAIADDGRTVIFSSHLLDEVERVSDHVAMIAGGRVVLRGPLEAIQAVHHRFILRFAEPRASPPSLQGQLSCDGEGREWAVVCEGSRDAIALAAGRIGGEVLAEASPSLDEIFVARVGARKLAAGT